MFPCPLIVYYVIITVLKLTLDTICIIQVGFLIDKFSQLYYL